MLPVTRHSNVGYLKLPMACSCMPLFCAVQFGCQAFTLLLQLIRSDFVAFQLRLKQVQVALLIQLMVCRA